jgi:hypothetical protein
MSDAGLHKIREVGPRAGQRQYLNLEPQNPGELHSLQKQRSKTAPFPGIEFPVNE